MSLRQFNHVLSTFRRDKRGTSAVEFAIVAPMFIAAVLAISDVTNMSSGASNMQSAVRAGIQYALKGGSDATTMQTQANGAWTNKPSGATLTTSQSCKCAGASHACNTLCADNTQPYMYMTVTATASLGGNYYNTSETITESVRVQ